MFYAILIQYFTKNLPIFYVYFLFDIIFYSWNLNLFLYQKNICFILGKLKFVLLLSHFLVNIRSANIDKVFSMLSSPCLRRFNVDKPTLFQRWYFWYFFENESWINVHWLFNVETTLAYRRWIVLILSMLFCNFDKYTSAQLSNQISTL